MAIRFTDEMKLAINNALANKTPCLIATASRKGEPTFSYRGSMMVFDDQRLAWWERGQRKNFQHIQENPRVMVAYVDFSKGHAWKIYGNAQVYPTGPMREQVMQRTVPAELNYDPERKGVAIVVDVALIADFMDNPLQTK